MAELIDGALDALDTFTVANLQTYLNKIETALELTAPSDLIQDEIDLDKYRRDVEIFLVPNEVDFEVETMDGGRATATPIDLYCFIRRADSQELYKKINFFAAAIAKMIFENPDLGGTIGLIDLKKIRLYQKAEGKPGIKGFRAELEIIDEY